MARKPKSKTALTRELHDARALAGTQITQINGLMVAVARQRAKHIGAIKQIFAREIEIARLNGYIDRVRENEESIQAALGATSRVMSHPPDQHDLAAMRERLINAPQEDFDRMVDEMDDETLERVTGRDDADYSRG